MHEEKTAGCCRYKHTPRSEESLRLLQNRLSRISGQLNGIRGMLEENRYCGDILTQVAAAESALQAFGYAILQEHLHTCVTEALARGDESILDEAVELMKKLR